MSYLEKLRDGGSIVCMGLDPVIQALPANFKKRGIRGVPLYFKKIFSLMEKSGVYPGAFKLNQGFYVKHDRPLAGKFSGSRALAKIITIIREKFSHLPIILDYKRGDISTSSANYAHEGFNAWGADAVTVSPYMGSDSVAPFFKSCNSSDQRGVYILNRNSNQGARDFQNLMIADGAGEKPFYMAVAEKIAAWAQGHPGVGAVVGATSPEELIQIARFYAGKEIPLLIPGVGAQGGTIRSVLQGLEAAGYELRLARINSSSGITHPWHKAGQEAPENWRELCVSHLEELNRSIKFHVTTQREYRI